MSLNKVVFNWTPFEDERTHKSREMQHHEVKTAGDKANPVAYLQTLLRLYKNNTAILSRP